jgi:hypothetical protein
MSSCIKNAPRKWFNLQQQQQFISASFKRLYLKLSFQTEG